MLPPAAADFKLVVAAQVAAAAATCPRYRPRRSEETNAPQDRASDCFGEQLGTGGAQTYWALGF